MNVTHKRVETMWANDPPFFASVDGLSAVFDKAGWIVRLLDALAFSSALVAGAAAALAVAAGRGMGINLPLSAVGLVFTGTLVVYNVDRLRDLERDRLTARARSTYVSTHRQQLVALCALSALSAGGFALADGRRAALLAGVVLAVGLAHRRLKGMTFAKPLYVTLAWLAVVVGIPAAVGPAAHHVIWVTAILGSSLLANAIASDVRDADGAARLGPERALSIARWLAATGVVIAFMAPRSLQPLMAVALPTLLALLMFRRSERFGLVVVDGALLVGGIAAILLALGSC